MDPKNVIIAALTVAFVYDGVVGRRNQKKFASLKESNRQLVNLDRYLVDIIERHEVPLNKFDRIAITDLIESI